MTTSSTVEPKWMSHGSHLTTDP